MSPRDGESPRDGGDSTNSSGDGGDSALLGIEGGQRINRGWREDSLAPMDGGDNTPTMDRKEIVHPPWTKG